MKLLALERSFARTIPIYERGTDRVVRWKARKVPGVNEVDNWRDATCEWRELPEMIPLTFIPVSEDGDRLYDELEKIKVLRDNRYRIAQAGGGDKRTVRANIYRDSVAKWEERRKVLEEEGLEPLLCDPIREREAAKAASEKPKRSTPAKAASEAPAEE